MSKDGKNLEAQLRKQGYSLTVAEEVFEKQRPPSPDYVENPDFAKSTPPTKRIGGSDMEQFFQYYKSSIPSSDITESPSPAVEKASTTKSSKPHKKGGNCTLS